MQLQPIIYMWERGVEQVPQRLAVAVVGMEVEVVVVMNLLVMSAVAVVVRQIFV